jgi:glycerate kinase
VSPRTPEVPIPRPPRGVGALIPQTLLVASGAFGRQLSAAHVTAAIGRGVQSGGRPEPDLCPLVSAAGESVRELLDALDFDARMRRARAVIIGDERLQEHTLAGSLTFEMATRARQGGVPAYAVTGENDLNAFDARILDIQLILQARTPRALAAAGRTLAQLA